ncbi:MAG: toprim domain-containing protein [Oxalobacteraceae bacterium]|jgi:DNA primase|nr:toprim domain-containing protein [Oxalobacteraceae bacterium]
MDTRDRRNQTNLYTASQVKRVLSGSGVTVEKESESEYIVFCPFHANHRTPAGEINKYSGLFFCFSCGKTADLIELVMHFSNRTYFESVRFIKSKEVEVDILSEINSKLVEKEEWTEFDFSIVQRLHEQALVSERAKEYFVKRKITKDSVIKFKLGYSETQDMISIPVHNHEGLCVGFVARSIEGKDFKNTTKLPKSKLLFNLNRVKTASKVYVVESSFDAIRLDQVGFPAVATLGANVSTKQLDLLEKYFSDIIVIADNDEAGSNMKDRLIKRFGSSISIINIDSRYKDIGEMEDEEIMKLSHDFDKSILSLLN